MSCTEAYKEHIMYTFNGFGKTVMRYAAITAWRDRSRWRQKEISLENEHINRNTEDSIKQCLVAALFKFRFDEHEV